MTNTPRKTKTRPKPKPKLNPISTHLLRGRSVSETAKILGISTSRIYEYAAAHNLPTNKPILPGSQREAQVLAAANLPIPSALGSLDAYIGAVHRMPMLTLEEEQDLAGRLRETNNKMTFLSTSAKF